MAYVPLHARVSLNARMHGCARGRMCACAHPYMCVSVCVLCRLGACSWPTLHERVSAQGLELRVLSDLGCEAVQGFLFSPGVRPEQLAEVLKGQSVKVPSRQRDLRVIGNSGP